MTTKIAAAAMVMAMCSFGVLPEPASAYEYIVTGKITEAKTGPEAFIYDRGPDVPGLIGQTLTFDAVNSAYPSILTPDYALYPFIGSIGFGSNPMDRFNAIILGDIEIHNDSLTSSVSIGAETDSSRFDGLGAADGGGGATAASDTAKIPLDPEQSFHRINVTGSGAFGGVSFADGDDISGGYLITFEVETIEGIGSIPAIPLPASCALFGFALLSFGTIGFARRQHALAVRPQR